MTAPNPYLVFRAGGFRCALEMEIVIEVTRMAAIEPYPGMPPSAVGFLRLRGFTVHCIELPGSRGVRTEPFGTDARIIVYRSETGPRGILVERIEGIRRMNGEKTPPPAGQASPDGPSVKEVLRDDGGFIFVLDPASLAASAHTPGSNEPSEETGSHLMNRGSA